MLQQRGTEPTARRQKTRRIGPNSSSARDTSGAERPNVGKCSFPDIRQQEQIQPRNNNSS